VTAFALLRSARFPEPYPLADPPSRHHLVSRTLLGPLASSTALPDHRALVDPETSSASSYVLDPAGPSPALLPLAKRAPPSSPAKNPKPARGPNRPPFFPPGGPSFSAREQTRPPL